MKEEQKTAQNIHPCEKLLRDYGLSYVDDSECHGYWRDLHVLCRVFMQHTPAVELLPGCKNPVEHFWQLLDNLGLGAETLTGQSWRTRLNQMHQRYLEG